MTETNLHTEKSLVLNRAIASSCRILAIREHSEKQLQLKLYKKSFESSVISDCINFLKEEDWLSEERFCNAFIRSRVEKGQGLQRIRYELKQQEIAIDIIQKQLNEEKIDWQLVCDRVLHKKISASRSSNMVMENKWPLEKDANYFLKPKDKKKIENFLLYRGFSMVEIKKAFGRLGSPELRGLKK